jgi:drug/metabolite transporter (DMT)-like permease
MLTKHRGEFYLVMGSLVFAFNGVISTVVLEHISPFRLAQVRSIGAFLVLLVIALIIDRESLKTPKKLIPRLAAYGIIGFAAVQAGYFLGIQRGVPLSLVLIIEFTAPIWIALMDQIRSQNVCPYINVGRDRLVIAWTYFACTSLEWIEL